MKKIIDKTVEYLFYFFIFTLPFQTRLILESPILNGWQLEYLRLSLYASDVLLIIIWLLLPFGAFWRNHDIKKKTRLWLPILALILFSVISLFTTTDLMLTAQRLIWLLLGIATFYLIAYFPYKKKNLIMVLLFSLFFQALIGITQFYLQESPAVTVLGMAHHEAGDLGAAVVENNNGRWLRAYGSFDHPNIFGGVMMVATGLVLLQLLRSRKGEKYCFLREIWDLVRIKINKRSKSIPCWEIGTKMLFVFFIVFVSALFFSFSRSAWLGLIIIFISLIVILALKSDWQEKMTKLLKTILLSLILLSPILIFNGDLILSRTLGSGRLEISSLTERVASFSNFESIISSSWLTGVGLGNYSLAAWLLNPNYQGWAYQPVHNTLAFIWAEGGILVLLSFLAVIISIIYNLVKRNNEDRYSLVIVLGIIALFFFDHWLASLHFGVLFFWLILGLLIKKEECIN